MTESKYHIFRVYDYKGGELSSSLNLTKDKFICSIIEYFIDYDEIEFNKEIPDIQKLSKDILENIKELSNYAGGDSIVAEFYRTSTESMVLESITLEKFVKDNILDVVKQYCKYYEYELAEDDIKLLNKKD
jgi:hypothetical protein